MAMVYGAVGCARSGFNSRLGVTHKATTVRGRTQGAVGASGALSEVDWLTEESRSLMRIGVSAQTNQSVANSSTLSSIRGQSRLTSSSRSTTSACGSTTSACGSCTSACGRFFDNSSFATWKATARVKRTAESKSTHLATGFPICSSAFIHESVHEVGDTWRARSNKAKQSRPFPRLKMTSIKSMVNMETCDRAMKYKHVYCSCLPASKARSSFRVRAIGASHNGGTQMIPDMGWQDKPENTPYTHSSTKFKAGNDSDNVLLECLGCDDCDPNCVPPEKIKQIEAIEKVIERTIFDSRFLTLFAVIGSLAGALLCFLKGCLLVTGSFTEYFSNCYRGRGTGQVILLLVEAVDVYLIGTVMLIFGLGVYELFINSMEVNANGSETCLDRTLCGSNFFGLFRLKERPRWLEIRSLDELKTKLGHVIVMVLLVGMFERSKMVTVTSGLDLFFFSASILFAAVSLYLMNRLSKE